MNIFESVHFKGDIRALDLLQRSGQYYVSTIQAPQIYRLQFRHCEPHTKDLNGDVFVYVVYTHRIGAIKIIQMIGILAVCLNNKFT